MQRSIKRNFAASFRIRKSKEAACNDYLLANEFFIHWWLRNRNKLFFVGNYNTLMDFMMEDKIKILR